MFSAAVRVLARAAAIQLEEVAGTSARPALVKGKQRAQQSAHPGSPPQLQQPAASQSLQDPVNGIADVEPYSTASSGPSNAEKSSNGDAGPSTSAHARSLLRESPKNLSQPIVPASTASSPLASKAPPKVASPDMPSAEPSISRSQQAVSSSEPFLSPEATGVNDENPIDHSAPNPVSTAAEPAGGVSEPDPEILGSEEVDVRSDRLAVVWPVTDC
jgi:hypothetical protein